MVREIRRKTKSDLTAMRRFAPSDLMRKDYRGVGDILLRTKQADEGAIKRPTGQTRAKRSEMRGLSSRRELRPLPRMVFLTLMFLVLLKPDIVQSFSCLGIDCSRFVGVWNALIVAVSILSCCVYFREIGLDIFGGLLIAIGGVALLSTILNWGDLYPWAMTVIPCVATALLVGALYPKHRRELVWSMFCAATAYLALNLIFIVVEISANGFAVQDYLFYGYRNSTFMIAFPATICSLLLDDFCDGRTVARTVSIAAVSLFELLVGYSATSVCAYVAAIAIIVVARYLKLNRLINGLTVAVAYFASFFGIVIFRLQDLGSFVIRDVLGRSTTFSGRTLIWDQALTELANGAHWVFGYGMDHALSVSMPEGLLVFYPHNEVLQLLLAGGVLLLVACIVLAGFVLFRLYAARTQCLATCFCAVIFGYCIIGLMESSFLNPGACFVVSLAYYWCGANGQAASRGKHGRR